MTKAIYPKLLFIILFLSFNNTVCSQQVEVKGIAIDTFRVTRKFSSLKVILNDTLRRLKMQEDKKVAAFYRQKKVSSGKALDSMLIISDAMFKQRLKLAKDTNVVVTPNSVGEFRIKARLTDSLCFISDRFIPQIYAVSDLLKMDKIFIKLVPEACEQRFVCTEKSTQLYAFIGEKISVKYVNPYYCDGSISFDGQFECEYKVIRNIHGKLQTDTVKFTAYDHYGTPHFSKYQYVLLFLGDYCGRLFHEKYQYFDVYPTTDGRWARPGDPYELDSKLPDKQVKAKPIKFKDSVAIDLSDKYSQEKTRYVSPYFKIINEKAIPLQGAYIEDLLEIKKQGVLKARGYQF